MALIHLYIFIAVCCNLIKSSHLNHPDSVTQVRIDIIRHICRLSPTAISQATKTCVSFNSSIDNFTKPHVDN